MTQNDVNFFEILAHTYRHTTRKHFGWTKQKADSKEN